MLINQLLCQSPGLLNLGRLPVRATFFTYHDEASALAAAGSADRGTYYTSLNGSWAFKYLQSPAELSEDMLSENTANWDQIAVPGAWTVQGYDKPHYTNVQMPYPDMPPAVPKENPTGVYRREFVLDESWRNRRIILHFDGVESFFAVRVNDQDVGMAKDSRAAHEFDITDFCCDGTNTIAVTVVKWSDANFIEDQDMFWHGGIVRDVYLLSRPQNCLCDIFACSTLQSDCRTGELAIKAAARLEDHGTAEDPWKVRVNLYDPSGKAVKGFPQEFPFRSHAVNNNRVELLDALPITLPGVKAWSGENPQLYKLSAALVSPDGKVEEYTALRIGFRRMEITERQLLINGERVLICGVNRHESHPRKGRTVNREDILKDLKLMKQFNINAIRTSHYPDCPDFYDLCDELGFYVWDEANLEHHAFYTALCNDPQWIGAFADRAANLVERDKNHPCVIVWSMGNEAGVGFDHAAMAGYIRRRDPSRVLHYEGAINNMQYNTLPMRNLELTDIVGPMYPPPEKLYEWSKIALHDPRPYIMCEFNHAMGNSNGELCDYFEAFEKGEGLQGGFIWEWCDHAIYKKGEDGKEFLAYGGDFGDMPNDGNFVCDGLVGAERDVHPGLYEYKYFAQPVRFYARDLANGIFEAENRRYFSDYSQYKLAVTFMIDGKAVKKVLLDMPKTGKTFGTRTVFRVDYPDWSKFSGRKAHILLEVVLKKSCWYAEKGFEVAHEQFELPIALAAPAVRRPAQVKTAVSDRQLAMKKGDFELTVDRSSGMLSLYSSGKLFAVGGEPWFWRAPTDNDGFKLPWLSSYLRPIEAWLEKGYDKFAIQSVKVEFSGNGAEIFRTINTPAISEVITHKQVVSVDRSGNIVLENTLDVPEVYSDLPRLGLRWQIFNPEAAVDYLGMGPLENYCDRMSAAIYSRFAMAASEMPGNYLMPQSAGNRTGVEELQITTPDGVLALSADKPFEFSVAPYSDEELFKARHWHELPLQECCYLYTDIKHRGVGTRSCGPQLNNRYRIQPGVYNIAFNITGKNM